VREVQPDFIVVDGYEDCTGIQGAYMNGDRFGNSVTVPLTDILAIRPD
jgi:hypothetical protein